MTERKIIRVGGMMCVRCAAAVEHALHGVDGVEKASVSYAAGRAEVVFDTDKTDLKKLGKAIKKAGYSVIEDPAVYRLREKRTLTVLFCVSAVFALPFLFMMFLMLSFPDAELTQIICKNGLWQLICSIPVQFGVGFRFYRGAVLSILNKSPSMDVLVSVGTTAAWGYSLYNFLHGGDLYFEGAVVVITLVLLGKMLEARAKTKTSAAIEKLMKLTPKTAVVLRNGEAITLDVSEIVKGDSVLIRPGDGIPIDGIVSDGASSVDESVLTGESMPVFKEKGAKVFGGTVNIDGALTVTAENIGDETAIAAIIRTVEDAQSSKAHIGTAADQVSAIFVPSVLVISVLTLVLSLIFGMDVSDAVSRAVAVLVIACPCSLGLATPTTLMVGMGRGAESGILIKSADALEHACKIKAIALDKTGTVTEGKPSVSDFFAENDGEILKQYAAAVERGSAHPSAAAIVSVFSSEYACADFFSEAGKGVGGTVNGKKVLLGSRAWIEKNAELPDLMSDHAEKFASEGKTVILEAVDGVVRAVIGLSDTVRKDAPEAIGELKKRGIHTAIVTGDNRAAAEFTAKITDADEVIAEVLPEGKVEEIRRLKEKYGFTAMAGDGINDAPALASADVSFAVGSGTEIAMETGDIVLVGSIALLPEAIDLSKATMRKIKQNLFWAFFYNSIGIPLAALGFLSPVIAGAAMAFSSVSVVTNSLLLRKVKFK